MLLIVFLLGLSNSNATNAADRYAAYAAWLNDDFIRVGVKKPRTELELSAKGSLLVLDGNSVIDVIRPGGRFFVIRNRDSTETDIRWVQIAAGSPATLEGIRDRVAEKHEELDFSIVELNSRLSALRIGPITGKAEADQVRKTMINEGFDDAFIPRISARWPLAWVDGNFDKRPLKAKNPALVHVDPDDPIRFAGNGYRGILRFRLTGNRIQVINELPLETYLRGVVPTELGPRSFPELEAIKAQAVAARTYAIKNRKRFNSKGYDICDTQACQAYAGTTNEDPMADEAILETKGLVLYYDDELIDALYTSTCGGTTDDVENVFPGRSEPYLRAKSSYVADYPTWKLPSKPLNRSGFDGISEDTAVDMLLYGFERIPDLSGALSGEDFRTLLDELAWVLGKTVAFPSDEIINHRVFWGTLAELAFFKEAVSHQIRIEDLAVLLRNYDIPVPLQRFAALLIRYDLIHRDLIQTFDNREPVDKAWAHEILISFCKILGPEPEWTRYRLEDIEGTTLILSRGKRTKRLSLDRVQYYLTDLGSRLEVVDTPVLEAWDRIYLPSDPFPGDLIKVKESGVVASVDRFSAFDSWIEKKTIDELERRARRYVRGIAGIRDVRILQRAETGRVTLLELETDQGKRRVDGLRIRWSLGVKDNLFDLIPSYKNGLLVHLTIIGRGWGHGVGMSQVGAFGLARMGWTYDKILTHYYTGVEIRPWGP